MTVDLEADAYVHFSIRCNTITAQFESGENDDTLQKQNWTTMTLARSISYVSSCSRSNSERSRKRCMYV